MRRRANRRVGPPRRRRRAKRPRSRRRRHNRPPRKSHRSAPSRSAWEKRATHKRSAAAEKQLLAKYGGREFRDDDGAYAHLDGQPEWTDGEWTVLAQKKRKKKEEYGARRRAAAAG